MNWPILTRCVLTIALIVGAFTETGIFTAISLTLIFAAMEVTAWVERKKNERKESERDNAEVEKLAAFIRRFTS